jgi:myo-inositol-1(or 4)-monophosphatase
LLRRLIEGRFPGHAIVGEEYGESERDSTYRWIIDPIDGTQSFIRGVPLYGVLIGLEIAGEVAVGVAHFPGLGEMVAAARGEGCRWNGRPAHVSDVSCLDQGLLVFSDWAGFAGHGRADAWARLCQATRTQRGWGDCYGHCLVATGRADDAGSIIAPGTAPPCYPSCGGGRHLPIGRGDDDIRPGRQYQRRPVRPGDGDYKT